MSPLFGPACPGTTSPCFVETEASLRAHPRRSRAESRVESHGDLNPSLEQHPMCGAEPFVVHRLVCPAREIAVRLWGDAVAAPATDRTTMGRQPTLAISLSWYQPALKAGSLIEKIPLPRLNGQKEASYSSRYLSEDKASTGKTGRPRTVDTGEGGSRSHDQPPTG